MLPLWHVGSSDALRGGPDGDTGISLARRFAPRGLTDAAFAIDNCDVHSWVPTSSTPWRKPVGARVRLSLTRLPPILCPGSVHRSAPLRYPPSRLARLRLTFGARELALEGGEGVDDLRRLVGAVSPADGDLPKDTGIHELRDTVAGGRIGASDERCSASYRHHRRSRQDSEQQSGGGSPPE